MSAIRTNKKLLRYTASFLLAAVMLAEIPAVALAQTALTVDIKANGQDGTVTIENGESWNYNWVSTNATICELTGPDGASGVDISGNDGPIAPGNTWYPSTSTPTTLTISCTDGTNSESDSVTIRLADVPPPAVVVTADIDINGSDGPVTVPNGTSWDYSWTSTNASVCEITGPDGASGVDISGNDGPIAPGNTWYPAVGSSTTLTLNCTNGSDSATDSVTISVTTSGGGGNNVTADIKINGQDGLVTINNGESWNYSWTSNNASVCEIVGPDGASGVDLSGNDGPIAPGNTWYPALGTTTVLTLNCTNGSDSATDQASIQVVEDDDEDDDDDDNNGGGGGSRRRNRGTVTPGEVLGTTTVNYCPFLTTYMRYGRQNDTFQVMKLQAFLKVVEGYDYVTVNGVFDEATLQAVHTFQKKYSSEVLTPWGINYSTGYVYITTLGKINQILCGTGIPGVTPTKYVAPAKPVVDKEGGCSCPITNKEGGKEGGTVGTTSGVPVVGSNSGVDKGQNDEKDKDDRDIGLAASIFTGPSNGTELMQGIYEFLLILIVLYILGSVLEGVLHKDVPENVRKRFLTKWITISVGLLVALVISYLVGEFILILPLLIALALSVAWLLLYPKKDVIRSKVTTITSKGDTRLMKVEETKA